MGEDYAGLSPEEIAAIKDDDDSGDDAVGGGATEEKGVEVDDTTVWGKRKDGEGDAGGGDAAGDDSSGQGEGGEGTGENGKGAGTDGERGDFGAGEGESEGEDEAAPEQEPFVPQFQSADEKQLEGLKAGLAEAKKKFDEGEIDFAVFSEEKDKYNEAKWKADFAQEANTNMVNERWKWEQERFLDDNPVFRDNASLNSAFVHSVNSIIGSDNGVNLSDRSVLLKAKSLVENDMGLLHEEDESDADKAKTKAIKGAKKSNSDRGQIPVDIGSAPSAGDNNEISEFAHLDNLSGEKFQAAIDRMTPDQLERYENS